MSEKILIIDDDQDTLRLVSLMLQKQGFVAVSANSGAEGIELADAENPDLISLDVMMPGMDGYEVARRLRSNEKSMRKRSSVILLPRCSTCSPKTLRRAAWSKWVAV